MSIFKNLFGVKTKVENPVKSNTKVLETFEESKTDIPTMDLFIDNETPLCDTPLKSVSQNNISNFLVKNYKAMGIDDGYEYHSSETLEIGKRKIRAEFQLEVDRTIQDKSERLLQFKIMLVNVERISDETAQNLNLTIEELNASIVLLKRQKEHSAENEGWVMNAIHSYHQGFVQGLNDYIAGENLLNSIKNI